MRFYTYFYDFYVCVGGSNTENVSLLFGLKINIFFK